MGLSRLAPLILLAAVPAGVSAAPRITADQALTNYRKVIKTTRELDCPRGESSDEIVVCGSSEDAARSPRLPLPVEPVPGERINGESASAAALAERETCTMVGPHEHCGGTIPISAIALGIAVMVVKKIQDPDD